MDRRERKSFLSKRNKEKYNAAGIFIPAGLLFGMGVGFLIDNVPAGMFGGLGLGMFAFGAAFLIFSR
jgi:F0F1-type ATP synthase assembly protein I